MPQISFEYKIAKSFGDKFGIYAFNSAVSPFAGDICHAREGARILDNLNFDT